MNKNERIYIIYENCTSVATYDDLIFLDDINEQISKGITPNKLVFRTTLQSANETNGNKRIYSLPVCREIVEGLKIKAKDRSLLQEIDHPISNGDDESVKRRAATVELKNSGSLIRNIHMEGNNVIAEVETLSSFRGPDLRDLIVKDRANIGFSLRMFGKLKPHPTFEGINEVLPPLKPITYDVVSNPSHKNARIVKFLTENKVLGMIDEGNNLLTESDYNEDLILENIHLGSSSGENINDFMKSLIRSSFENLNTLNFKL